MLFEKLSLISPKLNRRRPKGRSRHTRAPLLEMMEDRTLLSTLPDIRVQAVTARGNSVTVAYQILNGPANAFDIGFYRSANTRFDNNSAIDPFLDSVSVSSAADLAVGVHNLTFTLGAAAGQVALPGFGSAEVNSDYFILGVADALGAVTEDDADPSNEDNTLPVDGSYLTTTGSVFVHGTAAGDTITFAIAGTSATLTVNGISSSYVATDVTGLRIRSHAGNDTVSGGTNRAMFVFGGDGDDTLTGGGGNDTLTGGAGNDIYLFDAGMALGLDTIDEAGGGTDTLDFSATTLGVVINLSVSTTQHVNLNLTLALSAGNTIENVAGGAGNDALTGNNLNNVLIGGGGDDTLTGGLAGDTLDGGAGDDRLVGGAGNDTYRFDADSALGTDTIDEAGGGTDTLDFSATTRDVAANLSTASAQVINANLTLTLSANYTIEDVTGGAGNDALTGNGDKNVLTGGGGNDTLDGGAGDDRLVGGAGDDIYHFDADSALGTDTINEAGGGTDTLDFSDTTQDVTVDLSIVSAQVVNANLSLRLSANNTIENVTGGAGNDALTGNTLNNVLIGGGGDDFLAGGDGNDTLDGGNGDDIGTGSLGADTFIGIEHPYW
jgi:Ca2+-binding RTX toxin-like protein